MLEIMYITIRVPMITHNCLQVRDLEVQCTHMAVVHERLLAGLHVTGCEEKQMRLQCAAARAQHKL